MNSCFPKINIILVKTIFEDTRLIYNLVHVDIMDFLKIVIIYYI